MENQAGDAAFVADAGIDKQAMKVHVTRPGRSSSMTGEIDVLAARGGLDVSATDRLAAESAPLLGNSKGSSGSGRGGQEADEDDFSDLPWYRRPGVCISIPARQNIVG